MLVNRSALGERRRPLRSFVACEEHIERKHLFAPVYPFGYLGAQRLPAFVG
jgi:hypothetical protein